jgi:hypothetical protein
MHVATHPEAATAVEVVWTLEELEKDIKLGFDLKGEPTDLSQRTRYTP